MRDKKTKLRMVCIIFGISKKNKFLVLGCDLNAVVIRNNRILSMEIFVRLVEVIIWPITIFVLAIIFKSELKKIFSRLSNFKYKDFEVKFGQELENVEQKIYEIDTKSSKKISRKDTSKYEDDNIYTRLVKISELSPRASITAAWFELENAIITIARNNRIEIKQPSNITSIINELKENKYIGESSLYILNDLRRLRNEAAHAPDFALTQRESKKYIMSILKLAALLLMSDNS